jgi:hypothetical protein
MFRPVSFRSGPFGRPGPNGIYRVTQLLPPEGDDYPYRIMLAICDGSGGDYFL